MKNIKSYDEFLAEAGFDNPGLDRELRKRLAAGIAEREAALEALKGRKGPQFTRRRQTLESQLEQLRARKAQLSESLNESRGTPLEQLAETLYMASRKDLAAQWKKGDADAIADAFEFEYRDHPAVLKFVKDNELEGGVDELFGEYEDAHRQTLRDHVYAKVEAGLT